ncbi:MFS transporter [Ornithinicoccus halotolerans]|uniref:MFS transporter n=1 Tax=Ornithinicoccus halotolerans TaxID=1748220 RepID=UPI001296ED05|nr:MFS transporter [Ornithinicoccus halotolerans]
MTSRPTARGRAAAAGSPRAVLVVFAVSGFVMGQTLARVPAVRDQVGASQAELGLALVGGGLGAVLAMPFTARLVDRWGTRRVVTVALALGCLGWGSVGLAPTVWALGLQLLLAGAAVGIWDVAMNIEAAEVERRRGRTWMPYFHAAFSAGTVLGAALAGVAAWVGVGTGQIPVLALLALVAGQLGVRPFLGVTPPPEGEPDPPAQAAAPGAEGPGTGRGPGRGVTPVELVIGLVALGAALAEGAAGDWLALLLVDVHRAPEAVGAATFTAFGLTMFLGRLAGGRAIERWGRIAVVRAGALLTVAGILLLTVAPELPVPLALAGGLLWGLGIAATFPACMSAAAEVPGRGSRAIGTVATIAYGAFLFGAPLIGLLAEQFGLARALWTVVAFLVLMALLSRSLRPGPAVAAPRPAQLETQ